MRIEKQKLKISRGMRKYIRKEKARIRKEVLDKEEQERLIKQLYQRLNSNPPPPSPPPVGG